MLGNIQPILRSSLKCIQLIACITTPLLQKYGHLMVLKPFIRDVNQLSEVRVVSSIIVLEIINLYCIGSNNVYLWDETCSEGAVLFALADTLAAHSIGGFKVGVWFSLRKCRMCLATKEQMSRYVYMCMYMYIYVLHYSTLLM